MKDGKIRSFYIHPTTGELISIVRGQSGFYPYLDPHKLTPIKGDEAVEKMEQGNTELGLTDEQVESMFAGSLFGWQCPAAEKAWTI